VTDSKKSLAGEIAELNRLFSKADSERNRIKEELANKQREFNLLAQSTPVKVSDHALLRYLERKYAIDTKKARQEIFALTDGFGKHAKRVTVDGLAFIISEGVVVTCY